MSRNPSVRHWELQPTKYRNVNQLENCWGEWFWVVCSPPVAGLWKANTGPLVLFFSHMYIEADECHARVHAHGRCMPAGY